MHGEGEFKKKIPAPIVDSIDFFPFRYSDIFWKNVVNIKIIRLVTKDRMLLITVIFCLLWDF